MEGEDGARQRGGAMLVEEDDVAAPARRGAVGGWRWLGRRWLGVCMAAAIAAALLPGCEGKLGGFRYGDISWKTCDGGFYDPLFPEVCEKCVSTSNPALCVGVTVRVAISTDFVINDVIASPFLTFVKEDVARHLGPEATTHLRLKRSTTQQGGTGNAKELRIGYLNGLGALTEAPDVNDPYSGLVDCSLEPCGVFNDFYTFRIDRVSPDGDVVYARFSFQQKFSSFGNGDYTIYMDGCCRPAALAPSNNQGLVFHIRAGLKLPSSEAVTFPRQSIVFKMPDVVTLRMEGNARDNSECRPDGCSGECFLRFQIQAYHPDDAFHDKIRYYIGNQDEMGRYRCSVTTPDLCNTESKDATFATDSRVVIDPVTGVVVFPVAEQSFLTMQLTIMAECEGCAGGSRESGSVSSVPLDLIVIVVNAEGNPNPPEATFVNDPVASALGIPLVTLETTRSNPVQIACGNTMFTHNGETRAFIRVGFKDRDDSRIECPPIAAAKKPQALDYITQGAEVPKGVTISPLRTLASGENNGAGYVDVTWRPQCEDPSQVGRQLLCWQARDRYLTDDTFLKLVSAPSPVQSDLSLASENPTCVHVTVLSAAQNEAPKLVAPTEHTQCSEDCCSCCGQAGCTCEGVGECCLTKFATASKFFNYTVRATDSDVFQKLGINFTFPEGFGTWERVPKASTLLYGCPDDASYSECASRGLASGAANDVTGQLVWDLRGIGKYMCKPLDINFTIPCEGLGDTATCPGGTPCTKLETSPFKVCFQIVEVVSSFVDVALWRRTFGTQPGGTTCKVCFKLQVSDRPFFEDVMTPRSGSQFFLAVGQTLDETLLAASEIVGKVVITMPSDPGAPNGASLTRSETVTFADVDSGFGYTRRFVYTPQASQRGHTYTVCFRAIIEGVGADVSSDLRCWKITVLAAVVSWDGSLPCPALGDSEEEGAACPSEGHVVAATVGCPFSMALKATAPRYAMMLSLLSHPTLAGGLGVTACLGGDVGPCCGNGHCDGAESAAGCPADCKEPPPTLEQTQIGSAANNFASLATLKWTPGRGDEGRRVLICVATADQTFGEEVVDPTRGADGSGPSLCITFEVARCAYCVPDGATLRNVARHYMLNNDWLRLYNSNPGTADPDRLAPLQRINVGPTYAAQQGDTLVSIAASMRTTVKALLDHNRDLLDAAQLVEGQKVCVLLCSAAPAVV